MGAFGQILASVLWLYWVVFIARLVFDLVLSFARSWRPRGIVLIIAEAVFTVTDPPLRLVRRVIPPLRIGNMQFDLAFLVVLIALQLLVNVALSL